jgi:mono/diheme cytochrome c family protein
MHPVSPVSAQPNYGNGYAGSPIFGNGSNLGNTNFVVFAGAGSSVTVTNLIPGVRYYAAVYSYTQSGAVSTTVYNLADPPTASQIAPGAVQSISLQLPTTTMAIQSSAQATVLATYTGGAVVDVTSSSTYTSSVPSVATVSAGGLVQAVNYGSTSIKATYQGKQDSNTVTVVNPLTNNIRHRYTFAVDASDLVGTAHGTLQGGATVSGGALMLNGGGAFVDLPNNMFTGYTSVTFEMWVTDNGSGGWARIFDFGNSTGGEDAQGNGVQYMFLSLPAGGGNLRGAVSLNGGGAAEQLLQWVGGRPNIGTEAHIVWTSDQATHTGLLYVNGTLVGSNMSMTLTPAAVGPTVNNWLGKSQYGVDPYFNGSIDEFRVYDVALPPNLVQTNFQDGPDGLPLVPPVVADDAMTLNPGAKALIPVLQNDPGPGISSGSVTIVGAPAAGTALVQPGGKVLYTHNGGPATSDQFTYQVQNSLGQTSGVATVSLTISSALRLPNTTMTVPDTPPATGYQVVDAFPGLTLNQVLAMRTPAGPAYSNLLFCVERRGYISYIDVTLTNPVRQAFLDISNQIQFDVSASDGEMGLESMDFHPGFATNGIFFVSYIAPGGNPYRERLARFTANPANLTVATNTQTVLFDTTKREFNHCGADLHFGNDGYLYVSMGDEGNQYNFRTNAQRLDLALYSGMLRIDVDKKAGNLEPNPPSTGNTVVLTIPTNGSGKAFYSIPSDNPFLGFTTNADGIPIDTAHLRGEFYAIGMRHPWRFSVDSPSGEIWVGIVGQDKYEGVYVLKKGGNYGWPYYEANHLTVPLYGTATHPGLRDPPPGFVLDPPLWEYPHNSVAGSDPQFSGLDVNGSLVYHGNRIPALTNLYLFGDFDTGGNIWSLRRTNGTAIVERLTGQPGLAAFAADPSNGDVLMANYLQNKIQRLVVSDVNIAGFPQKLSDTGVFADLTTLAPNPGIVSYEPNIAFWSDYAIKRRWFTIPNLVDTVGFNVDNPWTLPTGMKWIKHFDLEMDRGNPATKRRIETRVLVKTDTGVYGVSYKWNAAQTEAFLVADGGDFFSLTVTNSGVPTQQDWEIPSRSACLSCHTTVGGFALTFNTRQMNKTFPLNIANGNQITNLAQAGYFSGPVPNPHTLPAFATATDTNSSLEFRVRSYLAVNCVQCHQPGGGTPGSWDSRAWLTLAQTMLINGTPLAGDGGDPSNKLVVSGDTNHSVVLLRLKNANGFSRMPPLATHQLDLGSISLVAQWIGSELTNHLTFAQWQLAHFGSTNAPNAASTADPDGDRASNYVEYLTGTDPQNPLSVWRLGITSGSGLVNVTYPIVPNLGVTIETSSDLFNWTPWDISGNQPFFGASPGTASLQGPLLLSPPSQFFRARFIEP